LLDCQVACILAPEGGPQGVELVSGYGMNEVAAEVLRTAPGPDGSLTEFCSAGRSVAIGDAQADPRVPVAWRQVLNVRALLCVPIWGSVEPLGFLFLIDRQTSRDWRSGEVELIESFVNRAAVALMNAHLHKQLEWAAALEERQRIAADMHDGLAQTVSILGLQVDKAAELTATGPNDEALEKLSTIREIVGEVSVDVRRSIASLKETPQPRRPLQDLLSDLPHQLPFSEGPAIDLDFREQEPLFLPQEQGAEALLVVQEALLNARRHAQAQRIAIVLERRGREMTITVGDDGRGFDPSAWWEDSQDHFGLSIMHARAARIGGQLEIDSVPGQGTRVILILPLDGDSDRAHYDDIRPLSTSPAAASRGTER
jgi:signal transduction histidine kinase